MSTAAPLKPPAWGPLDPRERRVLGALVEKAKTTPDNYPMSINAVVTACNQKSARDPITNYDEVEVDAALTSLRRKGAVALVDTGGRVQKYRHLLQEWLDRPRGEELAVLAELWLRGPQTEGDLRARASRMAPLPDLEALQVVLKSLANRNQIVYLTPLSRRRGAILTHGFYPPEELEALKRRFAAMPDDDDPVTSSASRGVAGATIAGEVETLRSEVAELRTAMAGLAERLSKLERDLGA